MSFSITQGIELCMRNLWLSVRGRHGASWSTSGEEKTRLRPGGAIAEIADFEEAPVGLLGSVFGTLLIAILCIALMGFVAALVVRRASGGLGSVLTTLVSIFATSAGFGIVVAYIECLEGGLATIILSGLVGYCVVLPIACGAIPALAIPGEKLTYLAIGLTCGVGMGISSVTAGLRAPNEHAGLRARPVVDAALTVVLATACGWSFYWVSQINTEKTSGVPFLFSALAVTLSLIVLAYRTSRSVSWKSFLKVVAPTGLYFSAFGLLTSSVMDRKAELSVLYPAAYPELDSLGIGLLAGTVVAMVFVLLRRTWSTPGDAFAIGGSIAVFVILLQVAFSHLDRHYRWWSPIGAIAGAALGILAARAARYGGSGLARADARTGDSG